MGVARSNEPSLQEFELDLRRARHSEGLPANKRITGKSTRRQRAIDRFAMQTARNTSPASELRNTSAQHSSERKENARHRSRSANLHPAAAERGQERHIQTGPAQNRSDGHRAQEGSANHETWMQNTRVGRVAKMKRRIDLDQK